MNVESKRIKHSFIIGNIKLYGKKTRTKQAGSEAATRIWRRKRKRYGYLYFADVAI